MGGYATSLEHALAELRRIDLLIRLQVFRARQIKKTDDPFQGLYITDDDAEALSTEPAGLPRWAHAPGLPAEAVQALSELTRQIDARKAESVASGQCLRLLEIERLFRLSPFDIDVILVCLAPELDLRYERLFAYLQDDVTKRRPSVDLVLNLLCESFAVKLEAHRRFAPGAPLVRNGLVEMFEDPAHPRAPVLARYLKLDDRILRFLLGSDEIDSALRPYVRVVPPADPRRLEVSAAARASLERAVVELGVRTQLVVHLHGPRGVGKKRWATALAARLGLGLFVVDGPALLTAHRDAIESAVRLGVREAALQGAAFYFGGFDGLRGDDRRAQRRALLDALMEDGGLAYLGDERPWDPETNENPSAIVRVELPRPDHVEREEIWARLLGDRIAPSVVAELPALAAKFRFTVGDIRAAVASACDRAQWRSPEMPQPTTEEIYASSRAQSNARLGELGRKVQPHYAWNDLVLSADGVRLLREMCGQVRHRSRVLGTWGFERKLSLGKGLAALFSGPPGTGKTMAAEVVAHELGLELYKIDLSGVVSKYIGETEKNLARVFAEAEASSAILFFDEADALFGKRSEVKDAHDRYANVETSYLLQRMEEYEGISILATNLRRNMDEAFARRIAFMVHFPLPEEPERLRIWKSVFPRAVPQDEDVDFAFLSRQFKVSGGNIKNIALAAAFLAAEDGGRVKMVHLVRATRRELQKLGKSVVPGEFGAYAGLLEG
jgi:SpoVK/Ycf46/Vps4 family AAA+-type ATPase